jgi:hypothetical protein
MSTSRTALLNLPLTPIIPSKTQAYLLLFLLRRILLHALLHPSPTLCRVLFHLRLILQQLLDRMRIRNVSSLFDARARCHALFPRLECRKLVNVDASPACGSNPAVVCKIYVGEWGFADRERD